MKNRITLLKYIEDLRAISGGVRDSIYTYTSNGEMSQGCICCKNGAWMCVFLGQRCNLKCPWCPNPEPGSDVIQVAGGIWDGQKNYTVEQIISASNQNLIKGVSYSGGEPLIRINEVLKISESISKHRNDVYQWIYTNGILLNQSNVDMLLSAGINEIRIDLAATNYDNNIIRKIDYISKRMICTIEVPVLEEHLPFLIDNLKNFQELGVKHINLHDLSLQKLQNIESSRYDPSLNYIDPVTSNDRYLPSIGWVHAVIYAAKTLAPLLNLNECIIVNAAHQWLGFNWQSKKLTNKTKLSFDEYKNKHLTEFLNQGITL